MNDSFSLLFFANREFGYDDIFFCNMRSITELDLLSVSEYLVGTWLVRTDKSKLKESVIIMRLSESDEEKMGSKCYHKC